MDLSLNIQDVVAVVDHFITPKFFQELEPRHMRAEKAELQMLSYMVISDTLPSEMTREERGTLMAILASELDPQPKNKRELHAALLENVSSDRDYFSRPHHLVMTRLMQTLERPMGQVIQKYTEIVRAEFRSTLSGYSTEGYFVGFEEIQLSPQGGVYKVALGPHDRSYIHIVLKSMEQKSLERTIKFTRFMDRHMGMNYIIGHGQVGQNHILCMKYVGSPNLLDWLREATRRTTN